MSLLAAIISIDGIEQAVTTPEAKTATVSILHLVGGIIGVLAIIGIYVAIILFMTSASSIPQRQQSRQLIKLAIIGVGVIILTLLATSAFLG
jgi:uncharacterized membrane protein